MRRRKPSGRIKKGGFQVFVGRDLDCSYIPLVTDHWFAEQGDGGPGRLGDGILVRTMTKPAILSPFNRYYGSILH